MVSKFHDDDPKKIKMVPTIVIAHTFCASQDTRISYRFRTIRRKQNLASALGIQKKNWEAFFRDN